MASTAGKSAKKAGRPKADKGAAASSAAAAAVASSALPAAAHSTATAIFGANSAIKPAGPRFVHPLHRCRFQTFQPSSIISLAFSSSGHRVALGRGNGNIEIWSVGPNVPGQGTGTNGWVLLKTIPGCGEPTVQVLKWARSPTGDRLFSAGLNGRLIEWDLMSLAPKYASDTYGGAVWCGALYQQQEANSEEGNTIMALGCEDGSIRLFDLSDASQPPLYVKSISRHTSRVLSIAYSPDGLYLVTGGSDGMIKLWDVAEGRNIQRITVENKGLKRTTVAQSGKKSAANAERAVTLIWCISFISSSTILSGDSLGNLQIWELEFGTLKQTFTKALAGDVLTLVVNQQRNVAYAAGVEGKIVELKSVGSMNGVESAEPIDDADAKWIITANHRQHTHDVYALALSPNPLPLKQPTGASNASASPSVAPQNNHLLVSGGVDTQLLLSPTICFPEYSSISRLLPFPPRCISVADSTDGAPRFMVQHDQSIAVYQLGASEPELNQQLRDKIIVAKETEQMKVEKGYAHLLDINVNTRKSVDSSNSSVWVPGGGLNLVCSSFSPNGRYIACSDPIQVKIYQIEDGKKRSVHVNKVKVKETLNPASTITFAADSSKLFLASLCGGSIQVVDLATLTVQTLSEHVPVAEYDGDLSSASEDEEPSEEAQPLNRREKRMKKGKKRLGVIRTMAVSPDQQYLAVADELNQIWVYDLDTLKIRCTLPIFSQSHLALEFHPFHSNLLAILCARNTLYMYDVDQQRLTDYTKTHLMAITSANTPTALALARDQFIHLSFDKTNLTNSNSLILQSLNHLLHINLDKPRGRDGVVNPAALAAQAHGPLNRRDRKRKLAAEDQLTLEVAEPVEADPLQVNFRLIDRFRPMLFGGFVADRSVPIDEEADKNQQVLKDAHASEKKRKKHADEDASTTQPDANTDVDPNAERAVLVGSSLLVIEAPWLNILQQLPQPMARHRYGT